MNLVIVYGLKSSRDDEIRYVGQTTQTLPCRLRQHRNYAKNKRTAVHKWMLREIGEGFVISIVQIISNAVWNETEIQLLSQLRSLGRPLLNHTEGGEGTTGLPYAGHKRPDLAERNRKSKGLPGRKHSEETKLKCREAKLGKPCPWMIERNKTGASKAGHRHTDESKRKISAAHKGREKPAHVMLALHASRRGVKLSPGAILKLRAGHKEYYDRRRQEREANA